MPRPPKHPDHKKQAEKLMNDLLDSIILLWTSEEDPQLNTVSEELEMSPAKVRKLLITAGVRNGKMYYENPVADNVLRLWKEKKSVKEIAVETGLSISSVTGYLPHSKTIYSLDTLSTEAERIKLFRFRKAAVEELQAHSDLPDVSEYLWKCVCLFENYPFQTSGRGKEHKNATKFRYTVTRSTGAGGRHYAGVDVPGYGNEIWIEGKEKSISRSTVMKVFGETETKVIGARHGEKLFETLMTKEERIRSTDMGKYFRISPDARDLNYDKFYVEGTVTTESDEAYTSHNTNRLDVDGVVEKIMSTDYVKEELEGRPHAVEA